MSGFRVWAPAASRVDLVLPGDGRPRRLPMASSSDGWWERAAPEAGPGTDYGFSVDGGPMRPDPRSRWQPEGVHGPSRVLDPSSFEWTVDGWRPPPWDAAVLYEIHIGTFTPEGTFDAAIGRLDALVDLGVSHVELMPVAEFPGERGWGYDGADLWAPHHVYGGPHGLARLVDACHARGLAVLLDVVYNHLGPDGNYLGEFGPYFTDRYVTPWGDAVNFDGPGSDEVRRFVVENALHWLRGYRFDGLRLDAVHAIFDASAVSIFEQLALEVDAFENATGREVVLVAESDLNDPRLVRSREAGGDGLDAQWCDDFHHALHALLTGEREGYYADFGKIADIAKALGSAYVYDGRRSAYRGRRHGRPPTGLPGDAFVVYAQSHDQVGNRARGERLSALVDDRALRIAAMLVLTSPFVPMLFQGEEWAASTPFLYFTDHDDPGLARAVREGRRREFADFGWNPEQVPDPQAPETFLASKLDWAERDRSPHREMLEWTRALTRLRREYPDLRDHRLEPAFISFDEDERWLLVERGAFLVAVNFGEEPRRLARVPAGRVVLASSPGVAIEGADLVLPALAGAVLEVAG